MISIQPQSNPTEFQYTIRKANLSDIPHLGPIEKSAGSLFREVGLSALADDEPLPQELLRSYLDLGTLWVGCISSASSKKSPSNHASDDRNDTPNDHDGNGDGEVVAFLAAFFISCSPVEGKAGRRWLHIAELSVHSAHQRKGLAGRLLRSAEGEIRLLTTKIEGDQDVKGRSNCKDLTAVGMSLTTYRDLPFNGPFYAKFGFQEIDPVDFEVKVGQEAREIWDEEQTRILRPERRCFMVKEF